MLFDVEVLSLRDESISIKTIDCETQLCTLNKQKYKSSMVT